MEKTFWCPPCDAEALHTLVGAYESEEFGRRYEIYECGVCATKRPDPFLTDAELTEYYTDEQVTGAGRYEKWIGKYRYIHDWIDRRVDLRGMRVVEIGSNSGNLLRYFKEESACDVVGVELSSACKAYSEEVNAVPVFERTFEDFAEQHKEAADLVAMSHVFEHIPQPVALLTAIASSLRAKGYLYIEIPNARMVQFHFMKDIGNPLCIPFHSYLYTLDSLSTLLERHGFSVVARRKWSRKEDAGVLSTNIADRFRHAVHRVLGDGRVAIAISRVGKGIVRFYPIRLLVAYAFRLTNQSTTVALLAQKKD